MLTPEKDGGYTIDEYPAVTLAEAMRERERIRELAKQGINSTQEKKTQRIRKIHERSNTFEVVTRECLERKPTK